MKLLYPLAPLLALSCAAPPAPPLHASAVGRAAPVAAAAPAPDPAPPATADATPPRPSSPCEEGATVDMSKLFSPVPGSFSAPGLDEVTGAIECDGTGSGYALVRRVGDHFEQVRFAGRSDPHESRSECRALRTSSGRDLLICREGSLRYGDSRSSVVAIDYARDDEESADLSLVSVNDTTDSSSCSGVPSAVVAYIPGYALVDLDGDGALDVRVTVRAARTRVPPRPGCEMGHLGTGNPPQVPSPPRQIIDFLARGSVLTPTPASARILAALDALGR